LADRSVIDSESRLDIAERILRPRWLSDVADRDALYHLQSELLAGTESRRHRPRSPHTVRSHMATVLSVLNWACRRGWLESVPAIVKLKTSKLKGAKGRPLALEEFERLLSKTAHVVGEQAAPSWQYLMRGLWTSALRLDELWHVHWTDETEIMPVIRHGLEPVLRIPAQRQKNRTEETIPLVPWFEDLLTETDEADRTGWAFNPETLQSKVKRRKRHGRPTSEWVGRIVSRIGKAAGVVVDPGDPKTEKPAKFASAHDLRRSCAENLIVAGVPIDVVQRILRHADFNTTRRHYATGNARRESRILREKLSVPGYTEPSFST
jgi:integrase